MTTKQKNTKPKLTCVSIGYQGRKVQDLCAELKTHGVELLLDVRQAARVLHAAGFGVAMPSRVSTNAVQRTRPAAGTRLRAGSTVQLEINP